MWYLPRELCSETQAGHVSSCNSALFPFFLKCVFLSSDWKGTLSLLFFHSSSYAPEVLTIDLSKSVNPRSSQQSE